MGEPAHYVLYFIILSLLLIPTLGKLWLSAVKKREPVLPVLILSCGILLISVSVMFYYSAAIFFIIPGVLLIIGFFIHMFRHPYLNESWLTKLIEDKATGHKSIGKYTSRPIVINKNVNMKLSAGIPGFSLLFKKNKVIARMSYRLFNRLGKPNMPVLYNELIDDIIEYERNRSKNNRPAHAKPA
jgi:hypothetical protein